MILTLIRPQYILAGMLAMSVGPFVTGQAFGQEENLSQDKHEFMQKLVGRWGHYDIVAYVDKMPLLGESRTMVISYGFTDYRLEGDQLIETDSFCHAEYKTNQRFESRVDDSFTRAIVPRSTPVEITNTDEGFVVYRPVTPTPIGVRMDPATETFPTDPHDPRISDDDNDGKPGVTVHVKIMGMNSEIYLARLEQFAYTMKLDENNKLKGTVKDSSKQLVVGASTAILNKQQSPAQHANLALSPILLVPLDASYDCDRLMKERNALFPQNPPIW